MPRSKAARPLPLALKRPVRGLDGTVKVRRPETALPLTSAMRTP